MIELKDCPFCGGEASLFFSGKMYTDYWKGYVIVKCELCSAASKGYWYYGDPIENPLSETRLGELAIRAWNMRQNDCEF